MKNIIIFTLYIILIFIFYQFLLSKNGLVEYLRIKEEASILDKYIEYLKEEEKRVSIEIDGIKKNRENNYEVLANKFGLFRKDQKVTYIKIKDTQNFTIKKKILDLEEFKKIYINYGDLEKVKLIISFIYYFTVLIFFLLFVYNFMK